MYFFILNIDKKIEKNNKNYTACFFSLKQLIFIGLYLIIVLIIYFYMVIIVAISTL